MKIIAIGHPGSGKTYITSALSQKTGIEKIDIDGIFDQHPSYLLSKRRYENELARLLTGKDSWIIDGYHGRRMPDDIWKTADVILCINLPKQELKKNVMTRYKAKKAAKEFSHWQSYYVNNIKNFWQIRFGNKALVSDMARISKLAENVNIIELTSRDEIADFIGSFRI